MITFEDIISFDSLYKAHRKARLGKRHKKEVIEFEMNLSENLWKLHYDLKYGKYRVSGYHKFMIYDPKEREIQAISYRDRVIQHSLCDNFLSPLLDKRLIYDNAACRKNKGTHFAIKRLRQFMASYYKKNGKKGYFIKLDIKKYFDSIDHTILKELLKKEIKDQQILRLLYLIIDSFNYDSNKGLPMGNQTSQCFALLYLDIIDRYIKEKINVNFMFAICDDMILLVNKKADAVRYFKEINYLVRKLNLQANPKSQLIAIKNGIGFLGWNLRYGKNGEIIQTINCQSLKRMKQKFSLKRNLYVLDKISLKEFTMYRNVFISHLDNGNTYYIKNKFFKI